eukprot:6173204-Pleurochrysis_carterae.AAC.2
MHSFPFCTRFACVLAERSGSAPQVLGPRRAHHVAWPTQPDSATTPEPPRKCVQPPHSRPLPDRT